MAYILLVIMTAAGVISVIFQKLYRENTSRLTASTSVYMIASSLFGIVFFFAMGKGEVPINQTVFWYALIYALICFASLWGNIVAFDVADLVYITIFSGAGGMIIPFVFEYILGRENFSPIQILAVVIRMIAVILPFFAGYKTKENKKGAFFICWILFLVMGVSTIVPKLYSEAPYALGDSSFCFWTNIFLVPFIAVLAIKKSGAKNIIKDIRSISFRDYVYIALSAITGNIGTLLLIVVLRGMSATVYTIISSPLSMAMTALVSVLMFKEKQTRVSYLCIALSILAVVLYVV